MASVDLARHSEQVHNGPIAPGRHSPSCCGTTLQVVALTRDDGSKSLVELLRCSACGQSGWRLDGVEVDKAEALGALNAAFAPATPAARRPRKAAAEPAAERPTDLSDLLAGWQVLGAQR